MGEEMSHIFSDCKHLLASTGPDICVKCKAQWDSSWTLDMLDPRMNGSPDAKAVEQPDEKIDYAAAWEKRVADAIAEGCPVFQKNGLPIVCQRAIDGGLLEHEHADHPDYKYPVKVEFMGKRPDFTDVPPDLLSIEMGQYQPHDEALIYFDDSIAVTLYECCYTMWFRDGKFLHGAAWNKDWALVEESRKKIWPVEKDVSGRR